MEDDDDDDGGGTRPEEAAGTLVEEEEPLAVTAGRTCSVMDEGREVEPSEESAAERKPCEGQEDTEAEEGEASLLLHFSCTAQLLGGWMCIRLSNPIPNAVFYHD